ncbi:hypothetical protein ACUIAC_05075 [Dermabacteraceae bacterium P13138]
MGRAASQSRPSKQSKVAKLREELQNRVFTDGAALIYAENMWQRQQLRRQSMGMQQQNQAMDPQR